MFNKKQKIVYRKNPYVGTRQTRRRAVSIVNDMLFAKTNNNESTKEEFNNISIQDINVNTMNGTIDTVGVNIPCTNSSSNIDSIFQYSYDNSNTTNNTSNLFNVNNDTQLVDSTNFNDELFLHNETDNNHFNNSDFSFPDTNLICTFVREWAINGNVSHIRISELLHLLRPSGIAIKQQNSVKYSFSYTYKKAK